ncbi:MAG: hypothetical protein ACK55Z_15395, partial [bacterium]
QKVIASTIGSSNPKHNDPDRPRTSHFKISNLNLFKQQPPPKLDSSSKAKILESVVSENRSKVL